jgi:probable F420-dependent oxidoreductase
MRIGVTFPTIELRDPAQVRAYAQAVEELGFTHLAAWEHVLGADLTNRPDWTGPNTMVDVHEPLVLFGFLAAVTGRIELVTEVLALPQRQTALVAKQVAEVDVLSAGRLRLGVGLGWAEPEFRALNESFSDRGRRVDEQIGLLKSLLSQECVTFHGSWHSVEAMGIRPLPVRRPVPLWLGGHADVSLRRVAALADGWMSLLSPAEARDGGYVERLRRYVDEVGRPRDAVGIEATVSLAEDLLPQDEPTLRDPQAWADDVEGWRVLGATHLSVNTMGAGFSTADDHVNALRRFLDAVGHPTPVQPPRRPMA